MNRKMVVFMIGQIARLEAALLLLPASVSVIYREWSGVQAFLITAVLSFLVGTLFCHFGRRNSQVIFAKEGFVIVALGWIWMALVGAVPFVITGDIPSYIDAFFETASGFTTTGSSILTGDSLEALSHGALFWRSFTHWVGGMGVLVMIMAIVPSLSGRTVHIMRAEMPGPIVGKLVPRVRDTAKILYFIYIGMTAAEIILLLAGGMPVFDSMLLSFGTAGTGGFGLRGDSIAGYTPYVQWVIASFMLLFGVNFNLYYLILIRRFREAFKSRELWVYGGLVAVVSGVITWNIHTLFDTWSETIRTAVFQVSSIVTTTGYATADFNAWPSLSRSLLFVLLFVGGCAGSTAGGLKISRLMLLAKTVSRDLKRLLHPRSVGVVQLEGKRVDEETVRGTGAYFILYCVVLLTVFLLLSFEPFDLETNLSAAITCLNNVGPGVGKLIGPAGNFAAYSGFSKIVLSLTMLFGRLEIYPMLFALTPSTWTKK